ncbi:thiamine diphosphokinase [Lacticaseibacillus camelliae]|uniref:Thiamine diphosphokinase n=1 Tax=Lacticaseibacillus camelliae DSM 22697 = JCM 13995 TaxID=1423730 RepID=A0A0R2F8U9_9LACO|nr:thiamine diphosphokinase [Lacticaseibacillus camelliae]KRN24769.1 Thiamine pyrophosphokinase [Lacticaseibacillus camelliae DSM 22697 = JCM 13995]
MTLMNLMVGGPVGLLPHDWQKLAGTWVGVDRGTLHLLQAGITPQFAVGDFDSLTASEFGQVKRRVAELHTAKPEKDETDTEMAVRLAFKAGAARVRLIGATGGRLDHFLSNLFLPTELRFQNWTEQIEMLDAQNWVQFYRGGTHELPAQPDYPYLGIVPLTGIERLNIAGAKYPLKDWSSMTPFSWASNEFLGQQPVTISWQSGIVAVVYSRDRNGQQTDN